MGLRILHKVLAGEAAGVKVLTQDAVDLLLARHVTMTQCRCRRDGTVEPSTCTRVGLTVQD